MDSEEADSEFLTSKLSKENSEELTNGFAGDSHLDEAFCELILR